MMPHMASWTWDSWNDLQTKSAEEVVRALKGEMPKNVVNPEAFHAQKGTKHG
jgi:phosphoglycerate dehydrogenase-like enzyme